MSDSIPTPQCPAKWYPFHLPPLQVSRSEWRAQGLCFQDLLASLDKTARKPCCGAHHWGKHLGHSCSCLGEPGPPAAGFLARLMRENREKTLVSTQEGGRRKRTELFVQIEAQSLGIWKSRGAAFRVPKYSGTVTSQTLLESEH